jgi:Protein of unknown function (DUF2281)
MDVRSPVRRYDNDEERRRTTRSLAMTAIESQLIERLKKLPPNRVAEVIDFVEFLAAREERAAAALRLTEGFSRIDALGLPPFSEDDVEEEVQAARLARRPLRDP